MSILASTAGILLAATAPPLADPFSIASGAQNSVQGAWAETHDPILLIRQAAVLARAGKIEEARQRLLIAIASPDRYDIELADGRWIDSRQAARLALLRLSSLQPTTAR